ncbi:MAG: hypothetical protein ACR2LT_03625 [Pyrinomonadaceae bacterium]
MSKIQNFKSGVGLWSAVLTMSFLLSFSAFAQQTQPLLKRTTFKTENIDFGAGGTLTLVGAPTGSISIEGWQKNEIEISVDIEVQAETEADLALLAGIDGFVIDNDFGHVRIFSVGTNDKDYLKRTAKKFPKRLLGLPFKIDYRIKVPVYCDLEINGGHGDFNLSNIQGAMQIKFLESNAEMNLTGGNVIATFGGGNVEIKIQSRSWRGRSLDVQVAGGNLNVYLQPSFNGDIDASILRTGKIENKFDTFKPRDRTTFTEKSIAARSGTGGASLNFTVGDGILKLQNLEQISAN